MNYFLDATLSDIGGCYPKPDASTDTWKPAPRSLFDNGGLYGEDGLRRILEMVCGAVVD